MNYGQVKRRALALAQQYSIAGVPVKESYNNQADALLKLPDLVNDAQLLIATTARPIPAQSGGIFIYSEISIKLAVKNTTKNPDER